MGTMSTLIGDTTDLASIAAEINAAHAACETASRAAVTHALDAGRLLIAAKVALPHGAWLPWLRTHVTCSERTAQLYMRIARHWSALAANPQPVTDMGLRELADLLAEPRAGGGATAGADPDEWYTPAPIIAAARRLLGGIDLDPASCPAAQTVVQATTYYGKADDGLAHPWQGRVWLNPPYSRIDDFAANVIAEHDAGHIVAALLLTNNATDATWFCALAERYPLLFTRGRVRFWHPAKAGEAPRYGQAVFGIGIDRAVLASAFAAIAYAPNAGSGPPHR